MEVFRPEVASFFLRPFLDDLRRRAGADAVAGLLGPLGVTEAELADKTSWVSLEFCETLFARLIEAHPDPALFERCGRLALAPEYLGMLRPLFRAFGSPRFTFQQVVAATPRFNKVGAYQVLESRAGLIRLAYRPVEGAPSESRGLVCRARSAQLAAIPTMFDLAPAALRHPECMQQGAQACVYELSWTEPGGRLVSVLGLVAGGAGAGGAAFVLLEQGAAAGAVGALGALAGWAVGRVVELRRDVAQRADDLHAHHDALAASAEANEKRYAELLEAKARVEEKVEQRTAELRQTSAQLAATLDQVQALDKAKTEFFSNVSHELRSPLTLLVGPLQELAAGREPPGGRARAFETMNRNAQRLLSVINQLLDLAKVDAGAARAHRSAVDPAALLRGVAASFAAAASARGIDVKVEAPESAALAALDGTWIESAVNNLLANAMRFARSRVTLRLSEGDARLAFEVEDDGPGIPAADVENVFERFAQAGDPRARKGGTGLGLAIVREAARLHGGEASVRSVQGQGTTFTVVVPLVAFEAEAALDEKGPSTEEAGPASTPPAARALAVAGDADRAGPSPDAPLVLVVEDDDDLRSFIADILCERYQVRTARHGAEGLAAALELRPDAIVSDVSMPEMDGYELTRQLRKRPETQSTPVLLVTARRELGRVLEGFEAGADDYVAKPFHGRELLSRVGVHVRLRKLMQELGHKERLSMAGVMAASVAHHVRNPLTSIQAGLPAISRRLGNRIDDSTREMMGVMLECAQRIERLTGDLLDLSRIDRAQHGVFPVADAVRRATRVLEPAVPDGVRLRVEIDDGLEVSGNEAELHQVVLNLVDNAIRACDAKGRIDVVVRRDGAAAVIEIADSGPGVDPAHRQWIFEPFATTRGPTGGTGLGLSIAKQVVTQHGGTIGVSRSPSLGGALFTIRIPLYEQARDGSGTPARSSVSAAS